MKPEKREIPEGSRLARLLELVEGVPNGTALSEEEAEEAIAGYIRRKEKDLIEKERKCLCCGEKESEWIINEDLEHLWSECHLCQACDSIISWSYESIHTLENVIAYLRLVEKQRGK